MLSSLLLACILFGLILAWQLKPRRRIHRNGHTLRRPSDTLPILGNAIKFLQPRHVLFDWFVQCQERFALETYEISVLTLPPGVVIQDPRNLEYVLKNEKVFTKGDFFRKRSWDLFGHGIINANGDLWKAQRKAGMSFFSGASLEGFIEVVMPEVFTRSRAHLLACARSRQVIDLQAVFLDLTTTAVGRTAYDMEIDSSSPFSRAFDNASDNVGFRFQNPLYRITELVTGSTFRSSLSIVKKYGQQIVTNARSNRAKAFQETQTPATQVAYGSLLESLMDTFDDPAIVADAALNFLSAGRDTTAQSLTWTFYLLMRHPDVVDRIRQEIASALPAQSRQSPKSHPKILSIADLQPTNLPYTMAVFYESLRLYPPVPFEIKQCETDTTLPDGTFLPAGCIVVWCIWAMNRSAEIWDPPSPSPSTTTTNHDLNTFDPSRWLVQGSSPTTTTKLITRSASDFPVFNGGPRACLGKKMAELIAAYVIVNLVAEFAFDELPGDQDGKEKKKRKERKERRSQNSLTLPMMGGLPCTVRRVDDEKEEEGGGKRN